MAFSIRKDETDIIMHINYSMNFLKRSEEIIFDNLPTSFNGGDSILQDVDLKRCGLGVILRSPGELDGYTVINNSLYYTLCDILDTDFVALSRKIYNFTNKLKTNLSDESLTIELRTQVFETLRNAHPLLPAVEMFEALTDGLLNPLSIYEFTDQTVLAYFSNYLLLQSYAKALEDGNADIRNTDAFRKFAHNVLRAAVPYEMEDGFFIARCKDGSISPQIDNEFRRFLEDTVSETQSNIFYVCKTPLEVCTVGFSSLLSENLVIKRCDNCGRLFVPYNRSDTLYCDRVSPQDNHRTCKEYGWYEKHSKNETKSLYRSIYMDKQMRAKRSAGKLGHDSYLKSFETYKAQTTQWKSDIKAGIRTEQEFLEWLKVAKERKMS